MSLEEATPGPKPPEETPEDLDLFEELEMRIGCDVGHEGGIGHTNQTPCQRRAEYTLNYHACQKTRDLFGLVDGFGTGAWCSFHLAIYTTNVQRTINQGKKKNMLNACVGCGHTYRQIADAVWNLTPIS